VNESTIKAIQSIIGVEADGSGGRNPKLRSMLSFIPFRLEKSLAMVLGLGLRRGLMVKIL